MGSEMCIRDSAPFFDITTTTVYLPDDFMALSLNGSKQWPSKKALVDFGVQHCMLKPQQVQACFEHIEKAMHKGRAAFHHLCKTRPECQELAEKMEGVWVKSWKGL